MNEPFEYEIVESDNIANQLKKLKMGNKINGIKDTISYDDFCTQTGIEKTSITSAKARGEFKGDRGYIDITLTFIHWIENYISKSRVDTSKINKKKIATFINSHKERLRVQNVFKRERQNEENITKRLNNLESRIQKLENTTHKVDTWLMLKILLEVLDASGLESDTCLSLFNDIKERIQ